MDQQGGQGGRMCREGEIDEHQEVTDGSCRKEASVTNPVVQEGWRNDEWARGCEGDVV